MKKPIILAAVIICAAALVAGFLLLPSEEPENQVTTLVLNEPFILETLSGHVLTYDGEKWGGDIQTEVTFMESDVILMLPLDESYTYTPSGEKCFCSVQTDDFSRGVRGDGIQTAFLSPEDGVLLYGEDMTFVVSMNSPALPMPALIRVTGMGTETVRVEPTEKGLAVTGAVEVLWLQFRDTVMNIGASLPELTGARIELDLTRGDEGIITVIEENGTSHELKIP